jgi:hypothetical protein
VAVVGVVHLGFGSAGGEQFVGASRMAREVARDGARKLVSRSATDIPSRMVLFAKTGDNVKASVKTRPTLDERHPAQDHPRSAASSCSPAGGDAK